MEHLIPCPSNVPEGELVNTFQMYCPRESQIAEANVGTRNNVKFPCVWVITYRIRDLEPEAVAPFKSSNDRIVIYKLVSMIKPRNTEIINHYPIKTGSSIILQDKPKIVEGGEIKRGYLQSLSPVLAAAAGPVLANILNKVVDTIDDKIT